METTTKQTEQERLTSDAGIINVACFGILPDSSTDQTAELNDLLSIVAPSGLYFPGSADSYIINGPVHFTAPTPIITIMGDGPNATVLESRSARGEMFAFTNCVPAIQGLQFAAGVARAEGNPFVTMNGKAVTTAFPKGPRWRR